MCRCCGAEMSKYDDAQWESRNSSKVEAGGGALSCRVCGETPETELSKEDSFRSCSTSVLSPMASLPSSDCSDYSAEMNSSDRSNLEDLSVRLDMLLQKPTTGGYIRARSDNSNANERDNRNDIYRRSNSEIVKPSYSLSDENERFPHIFSVMDTAIWEPPGPGDPDDDVEGIIAYDEDDGDDDDDDEEEEASLAYNGDGSIEGCFDRTESGNSISWSFKEGSASFKLREEKLRAMQEVYNGRFRSIVGQLFQSFGVAPTEEDGGNWVDIVGSLCWEAASFLKPNISDGKSMDTTDGCVKVKCFAMGARSQSEFIKGLVFKKHAAHKHMPTKFKNPKLLLIRGVLGPSSSGLLSLNAMEQEIDHEKCIIEMIEYHQPNVILVEKTVSRDIQEWILQKGMTLVLEMKLHRLERIARCTGSPILSSETMMSRRIKHCDAFRFEKCVEEHAGFSDCGKRSCKTLMFVEGCPTCRGCTILLKGSRSDELKRIKCIVRCAVAVAHHLVLETSFLVDQSAMFTTIPFAGVPEFTPLDQRFPDLLRCGSTASRPEEAAEKSIQSAADIPIAAELRRDPGESSLDVEGDLAISHEPYNPLIFSGFTSLSRSLKKVIREIPLASSCSSISSYLGFYGERPDDPIAREADLSGNEREVLACDEETPVEDVQLRPSPAFSDRPIEVESSSGYIEERRNREDNPNAESNSQSILVLMSSRNFSRGSICEQSHFSHIVFYKNFDVPLGKFLRESLLNQKNQCSSCGEPPGAHFYYYAHNNKQLTVQVRQIPGGKHLPGEKEGKLWMWSRCGTCESIKGTSNYTKRVLISPAARGLSFGKFLELSFSHYSSSDKFSGCGHSLYRDFLYFFGLGPLVAMFKYSQVSTYSVSLPPRKLECNNLVRREKLLKLTQDVYMKGMLLFIEIENSLRKIRSELKSSSLDLRSSPKEISIVEEMLKRERFEFEVNIHNTLTDDANTDPVHKFLLINRLLWELLLESCVWDRRLSSLLSPGSLVYFAAAEKELLEPVRRNEATELVPQNDDIDTASSSDYSSQQNDSLSFDSLDASREGLCLDKWLSNSGAPNEWFWAPFSEIRQVNMKEIKRNYIPKFETVSTHTAEYLPSAYQLIAQEGSRLHIPLAIDSHVVSDYDGELSSIVACVLATLYDQPIQTEIPDQEKGELRPSSKSFDNLRSLNRFPSNGSSESDSVHSSESLKFFSFDGLNLLDSLVPETFRPTDPDGIIRSLAKGKYVVYCPYFPQFRNLRRQCCPSESHYIASLSRCRNWEAQGGKSKSFFAKTLDDRYIIKEIKKTEYDSFMEIAPHYFNYMNWSFESGNQTCLAKVLGIYQVMIRQTKSGKETRHDLMVMENLTCGWKICRQYDLKGALHARFNSVASDVLLDQNFVNDMNSSPLYVSNQAKRILERAVWNDTTFLNSINVMDYSLLVGVDAEKRVLVCGIIDYLRQYTWDKHLETWVKSSLVPKNVLPTVISPKEYKRRFRKFMSTHFLSVPDQWCTQKSDSDDPCRLCGGSGGCTGDDFSEGEQTVYTF